MSDKSSVISNWGNYPRIRSNVSTVRSREEVSTLVNHFGKGIARGNGRCYGDASLSDNIISTLKLNKLIHFDQRNGIIKCESGVLLENILEVVIPRGWFLPVTPGTKFITVGGAIASDVHGKNHHKEGSFCDYIIKMNILCGDGQYYTCSQSENMDLFMATCGGMGLTGIILDIEFKLKSIESAFIKQVTEPAENLDRIFELFEEYQDWTYNMSWIDCFKKGKKLGRSVLFAGEHADIEDISEHQKNSAFYISSKRKISVPFYFPSFTLNRYSINGFNYLYYLKNHKQKRSINDYDSFFYPLDSILNWNKIYGKPGFVQYQFVLPMESSKEGLIEVLKKIRSNNMGSFLAVLKKFGNQNGLISFPMPGYTLALDFPVTRKIFSFLSGLDEIVLNYGGRLYLTKDARMAPEMFWNTYPCAEKFHKTIKKYNPDSVFSSIQSKRLKIT